MRIYLLLSFIILSSFSLSAQCPDYQSELLNVDSYISTAIRNLKKAEIADTLEKAQQFVDKAVSQIEFAASTANMAKEYAASCDCNEGINSATTIYYAAFDCHSQAQKAVVSGILAELKKEVKKTLVIAGSVKDEISEGGISCLEIPEMEKAEDDGTENN